MTRSPERVRTASVVALAGLLLMILGGGCSRKNNSAAESNRGTAQTQGSDSATQYNNTPGYNNDQNMGGATTDLQRDLADFRNQVDKKVADNTQAINDKRAALASLRTSMRAEFAKMLDDAEARNNEIRDRVLNYTPSDRGAWDQFRADTNRALDDVSATIGKIEVR